MRTRFAVALVAGILGCASSAAHAHAQVGGNLAAFPPVDLYLSITTTPTGPVVEPERFELVTGQYYRLNVTSEGDPDWRLELPDLLQNSHLRVVTISGIEVHLQGMVFRALEFDSPGTASFSFVPIRPGEYAFTVGDNPIALGLPAGQAGVQDLRPSDRCGTPVGATRQRAAPPAAKLRRPAVPGPRGLPVRSDPKLAPRSPTLPIDPIA